MITPKWIVSYFSECYKILENEEINIFGRLKSTKMVSINSSINWKAYYVTDILV